MLLVPHLMLTLDESLSMTDISAYVEKLNNMSLHEEGSLSESMDSDELESAGWDKGVAKAFREGIFQGVRLETNQMYEYRRT